MNLKQKRNKIIKSILKIVLLILLILIIILRIASQYYCTYYFTSLEALIFTIKAPKTNINYDIISGAVRWCLPKIIFGVGILIICVALGIILRHVIKNNKKTIMTMYYCFFAICVIAFVTETVFYLNKSFGIEGYLKRKNEKTNIYENYYVNPKEVNITSNSTTNNLIYIYIESMESDYPYFDKAKQETVDLTPNLSLMAEKYINFSETNNKGGFYSPEGTDWTMGGLFASTSGLPLNYSVDEYNINGKKKFAPNLITLGDILSEKGYTNKFICGSDFAYGGRKAYFTSHGKYKYFDFFSAYPGGWEEHNIGWWGFDDAELYSYAKTELMSLESQKKPFCLTMITVDTHFGDWVTDGYLCNLCDNEYEDRYANVIKCADNQIDEFIRWVQKQEFYHNTTIIIVGDHPFMGSNIKQKSEDNCTVYNCIINSKKEAKETKKRKVSTFDLFPTALSAIGYNIEGNKLGLGVDLFSNEETILEKFGIENLNEELLKYSQFYLDFFE